MLQQRHLIRAFGSWLLDVVAGYGYRPIRSLIAYVIIICAFAAAYFARGRTVDYPRPMAVRYVSSALQILFTVRSLRRATR